MAKFSPLGWDQEIVQEWEAELRKNPAGVKHATELKVDEGRVPLFMEKEVKTFEDELGSKLGRIQPCVTEEVEDEKKIFMEKDVKEFDRGVVKTLTPRTKTVKASEEKNISYMSKEVDLFLKK